MSDSRPSNPLSRITRSFGCPAIVAALFLVFAARNTAQEAKADEDMIKLKNGQEIIGHITAEDEKTVTVLFRGGEIVLPKRKIDEIIRGEKIAVEKAAEQRRSLDRYETRDEFYYLFYCGRLVGWRQVTNEALTGEQTGYAFASRSVYMKADGTQELDVKVTERVDEFGLPTGFMVTQSGVEASTLVEGSIERGFLRLRETNPSGFNESEALFPNEGELGMVLMRKLADATHFPDSGQSFKVWDTVTNRLVRMTAKRTLRKEVVAGKHQFVTVWRLETGDQAREVWIDGHGGVVREELVHANMVAMRAVKDEVLAYSRGETKGPATFDLELEYENLPLGFRLARPNLTWSFEFAEPDDVRAITLVNPTLQASVDVGVLGRVDKGSLPETLAMDLMERMERQCQGQKVLFQKTDVVGGLEGVRFEATGDRLGVDVHTLGAVTVIDGKAYSLLMAAPSFRFEEARPHLERILKSFEVTQRGDAPVPTAQ